MILTIDTSTSELVVGIADASGHLLKESRHTAMAGERGIHDARLALVAQDLFAQTGLTAQAISRIGLVIGPGSFTGLRIGLSFAKGFAFATGASIVTLTQHEVLAHEVNAEFDHIVTPGYRYGLYYVAKSSTPRSIELVDSLSAIERSRVLAHTLLMSDPNPVLADSSFAEITTQAIARLASRSDASYSGEEIDALEPLYVTDFAPGRS